MNIKNGTIEPEKIINIRSELPYRKQSVVSRALLEITSGNIDIMALDEGLGISEHVFKLDTLMIVLEGKLNIKMSSGEFILKKEEALLIPACKAHSIHAIVQTKVLVITFKDTVE